MNEHLKTFVILVATIILAIILILVVPSSVFKNGIDNAPTFINGLTTSTSIVVGFGIAVNGLMFHEITKNKPRFKQIYFESLGLFLIPIIEIWTSYYSLATGNVEYAVKTSLTSFLTAFLVIVAFWIMISQRIEVINQSPATAPTVQTQNNSQDISSKDATKNVQIMSSNKPVWIATKQEIEGDFEETRRCLLTSYHTYVQTHAGFIIALAIGFFASISNFKDFLTYGIYGISTLIVINLIIFLLSGIMALRIVYWSLWASGTIGISMETAIIHFNTQNKKYKNPYYFRAPNTQIIQAGINQQLKENIKNKEITFVQKLSIKTAGKSF